VPARKAATAGANASVTFGRLAIIDFELGLYVIVYLFTVLCDFVCWSILDVVDSRMSVNVGHMYNYLYRLWYILDWIFRDARGVYNGRTCG